MQRELFPTSTIYGERPSDLQRLGQDPTVLRQLARIAALGQQHSLQRTRYRVSRIQSVNRPGWEPGPNLLFYAFLLAEEDALAVDAAIRSSLAAQGLPLGKHAWNLLEPSRLHLSLPAIGGFKVMPPDAIDLAREVAERVTAPAAEMSLDTIMSFMRRQEDVAPTYPLVLLGREDGVQRVYGDLCAAMRQEGLRVRGSFNPHVTCCYGPDLLPRQPTPAIRLRFSEFALIHSKQGKHIYNVIDRWPLRR